MELHIQIEIVKLIIKLRRWLHFKYEELFQRATDKTHIVNLSFANSPLEHDNRKGQFKLKGGKSMHGITKKFNTTETARHEVKYDIYSFVILSCQKAFSKLIFF